MGIYSIENLINKKQYIGSSNNIQKRWTQHKSKLRRNEHGNPHLQSAWNKYGSESFEFRILETVFDECLLLEIEQHYLDLLTEVSSVYNICSIVFPDLSKEIKKERKNYSKGNSWSNRQIVYDFNMYNPFGYNIERHCTMREFCLEFNLNQSGVCNLMKGKIKTHKGWTLHSTDYKHIKNRGPVLIFDPCGNLINRSNIKTLCVEFDLRENCISSVLRGKRKQHRGWTLDGKIPVKNNCMKKTISLINPAGETVTRHGIKDISKEFNLNKSCVSSLLSGRINSHKGWTKCK